MSLHKRMTRLSLISIALVLAVSVTNCGDGQDSSSVTVGNIEVNGEIETTSPPDQNPPTSVPSSSTTDTEPETAITTVSSPSTTSLPSTTTLVSELDPPETSTTAPPTTSSTTTTTTEPPNPYSFSLVVAEGMVTPTGARFEAPLGETVRFEVISDTSEEVHVHGYDLYADVGPDQVGIIEFEADIPGIFEIELESSHKLLATLEVS